MSGSGTRPVGVWSLFSESRSKDGGAAVKLGWMGGFEGSTSAEEPLACLVLSIGGQTQWAGGNNMCEGE